MGLAYTKIPVDTFEKIVMNAGVVCKDFDPSTREFDNQIAATTGGLTVSLVPEFSDYGEDIDNCPKNMKELKKVNSYEASIAGTMVTVDAEGGKMLIGAADIENGKVTPRFNLKDEDFDDLWVVGDYSDVNTGDKPGCIAIHLMNALNTSGFSLTTTDKGKGQLSFTFTGHVSMAAQDVVPFELYVLSGEDEAPGNNSESVG